MLWFYFVMSINVDWLIDFCIVLPFQKVNKVVCVCVCVCVWKPRAASLSQQSYLLPTPPAFNAPMRGLNPRRNIAITFGMKNTTVVWLPGPVVKQLKICLVHERDERNR